MDKSLREYFRRIGRKGGKVKSPAKLAQLARARAARVPKRRQKEGRA